MKAPTWFVQPIHPELCGHVFDTQKKKAKAKKGSQTLKPTTGLVWYTHHFNFTFLSESPLVRNYTQWSRQDLQVAFLLDQFGFITVNEILSLVINTIWV